MKLVDLKGRKYLYKLIWFTCICVSVPLLVCGIVFYYYSMRNLNIRFAEESRLELHLMGERLDDILGGVEATSFTLSNYRPISELAGQVIDHSNTILWRQVLDKLMYEKNIIPYIDQLYYYSVASGILVSDSYGYTPLHRYPDSGKLKGITENATTNWIHLSGIAGGSPTYLRRIDTPPDKVAFILVEPNMSLLREVFYQNQSRYVSGSNLMVMDKNGTLIFAARPLSQFLGSQMSEQEIADTLDLSAPRQNLEGKEYYLTQYESKLGYTYVTITSGQIIFTTTPWIRVFVLLSFLLPLLLGVLLTVICAMFLYRPINTLINYGNSLSTGKKTNVKGNELAFIQECIVDLKNESEELRQYIEAVQPDLLESLLLKLIKGEIATDEHGFKQKCVENNVPVNARYMMLLVDVGKNKQGAENVANVLSRIRKADCKILDAAIYTAACSKTVAAVAVGVEEDLPRGRLTANIIAFANDIAAFLMTEMGLYVTIGVGRPCANFFELATSYNEALQALRYQICRGRERVLYISDVEKWQMKSTLCYPYELESAIIRRLKEKNIHDACLLLDEFLEMLQKSASQGFIRQSMYLFLSNIIFSFDDKETKLLEFFKSNLFDQIETCSTSEEIAVWLKSEVFVLYLDLMGDVNEQNRKMVIGGICHYIAENISFNISLAHCAEMAGMSPSYLSKIFKMQTEMNFQDYVVSCKIEKAKQLLSGSDCPIHEISKQVGYSERNFYRVFLKIVSMSPNEFREHMSVSSSG